MIDKTVSKTAKNTQELTFNGAVKATNGQFTSTTKQGNKPRIDYYKKTQKYFNRALKVWVNNLKSKDAKLAQDSATRIINKILPDIKAVEVTGNEGEAIKQYQIILGNGFIPKQTGLNIIPNEIEENPLLDKVNQ